LPQISLHYDTQVSQRLKICAESRYLSFGIHERARILAISMEIVKRLPDLITLKWQMTSLKLVAV
jgi:hypothetical protein